MKKLKVVLIIAGVIIFPLILDWCVFGNSFPSNISNSDWAAFLGSYIGGIATLAAVYITLFYEKKQRREEHRLSIRPYIDTQYFYFHKDVEMGANDRYIEIVGDTTKGAYRFADFSKKRKFIELNDYRDGSRVLFIDYIIRNVGAGSAVDMTLKIDGFDLPIIIAKDETVHALLQVQLLGDTPTDVIIEMTFSDVEGMARYLKKDTIHVFVKDDELSSKFTAKGEQEQVK